MATNFLEAAGTSGFIVTPFALMGTTDLSGLGNNNTVTSTASVLSQSSFGSAIWCHVWFQVVTTGFTPSVGGYISGWWLGSDNGGTNFEKVATNTDLARNPDFIIPFMNTALSNGDRVWANGLVRAPFTSTKAYIANHTGVAFSANNHLIQAGPVAIQY